jgi:hypothetical protein
MFSVYASDMQKKEMIYVNYLLFSGGGGPIMMRKVGSAYVEELK